MSGVPAKHAVGACANVPARLDQGVLVVQPPQQGVGRVVGAADAVAGELLEPTYLHPALVRQVHSGAGTGEAARDTDEAVLFELEREVPGVLLREVLALGEGHQVLDLRRPLVQPEQGLRQVRVALDAAVRTEAAGQARPGRDMDRVTPSRAFQALLELAHHLVDLAMIDLEPRQCGSFRRIARLEAIGADRQPGRRGPGNWPSAAS